MIALTSRRFSWTAIRVMGMSTTTKYQELFSDWTILSGWSNFSELAGIQGRSYAINVRKIEALSGGKVMVGGQYHPISRGQKDQLIELLKSAAS